MFCKSIYYNETWGNLYDIYQLINKKTGILPT